MVVVGVIVALVLPAFAIIACIVIVGIGLYVIRLKCRKEIEVNEVEAKIETSTDGKKGLEWEKDDQNDVERPRTLPQSTAPCKDPANEQLEKAFVIGTLEEEVPFDVAKSSPASPIQKHDAKTISSPASPIP